MVVVRVRLFVTVWFIESSDKYELVGRGLVVHRLSVWDNGTYECRAEVASHGNVRLRHVQLQVLCESLTRLVHSRFTVQHVG